MEFGHEVYRIALIGRFRGNGFGRSVHGNALCRAARCADSESRKFVPKTKIVAVKHHSYDFFILLFPFLLNPEKLPQKRGENGRGTNQNDFHTKLLSHEFLRRASDQVSGAYRAIKFPPQSRRWLPGRQEKTREAKRKAGSRRQSTRQRSRSAFSASPDTYAYPL